jgi:hypothetical protein
MRKPSGSYQLLKPGVRYSISHHVLTVTEADAVAIAQELDGLFRVEITHNTMSTGIDPAFLVILTHAGIPNDKTVPRAIQAIRDVARKHRGRHIGWDRLELPEHRASRDWLDDSDDDDDGDGFVIGIKG